MGKKISMRRYESASEGYEGYCAKCKKFTADGVEPDARKYKCPVCGEMRVYGAEEAMMMGLFGFAGCE